jgi:hypothetical protein
MSQSVTVTALWAPGWHELDQSLAVGRRQRFWFFETNPLKEIQGESANEFDLVFFNQLDSSANCQVRFAQIVEIKHKQLGLLSEIDTAGLDYIFVTIDGNDILVNAEEDPGTTYDCNLEIEDWSVVVTLSDLSEPIGKAD